MAQEIDYYCLNCGQKLHEKDVHKHMQGHAKEQARVHGKITRQLQSR